MHTPFVLPLSALFRNSNLFFFLQLSTLRKRFKPSYPFHKLSWQNRPCIQRLYPMGYQPCFECFASLLDIELSICIESMHCLEQTCFDSCRYTPFLFYCYFFFLYFWSISLLYLRHLIITYLKRVRAVERGANEKELGTRMVDNNDHFIIIAMQAIKLPYMMGYS